MPSNKRAGDEVEGNPKKKIAGSSRTGQACDRCKVRKIRCDARPGGCSPCAQNNTECKTTDRITGRATSRGHTENIENENASLRMYVIELQQQLKENRLEPKPAPSVPTAYVSAQQYWASGEQQGSWGDLSTGGLLPPSGRHGSQGSVLPEFRPGCIGDNYLGVSYDHNLLSSIEGTSLALFGSKVDLAEFMPPDPDPASSPMSYQTFLSITLNRSAHIPEPPLPPHDAHKTWAEFYFKTVQMFVPVLHKPDFMKLLSRRYHQQESPSSAEKVMLHMVLAIMQFQSSLRNGGHEMFAEAMSHYQYSLSLVPDLITGHTLQDLQALSLICQQLRSQPKPGAAWMFTNMVLGIAIEVGLHRSANAWQNSSGNVDPHHLEMRKRVFWSIVCLHVSIGGKLGRPMPLRLEDLDIEIPDALPDNMPYESDLSNWKKCSFQAGLQGFRLLQIQMQIYATVYSIRSSSEPYDLVLQNLDKQLQEFQDQLPPELAGGPETVADDIVPAMYLKASVHGFRLLLHHPSLCRSTSPEVTSNNLDVCLDASSHILSAASRIKQLQGLDTTWYYSTEYLAAIFTTLFVYAHRQDELTTQDIQRLRQDMYAWLDIMGEVGRLLGSGLRLQDSLKQIINSCIASMSRNMAERTASAGLASAESPASPVEQSQQHQVYADPNGYDGAYDDGSTGAHVSNGAQQPYSMNERGPVHGQQSNPYPSGAHFYPEPHNGSMPSYTSAADMASFDTAAYHAEDMKPPVQAPLNSQNTTIPQHHQSSTQQVHQPSQMTPQPPPSSHFGMTAFPSTDQTGFHAQHPQPSVNMEDPGPAAWRHFTENMVTSMAGQDYMNSANALMTLQADGKSPGIGIGSAPAAGPSGPGGGPSGVNVASMGGLHMAPEQQSWPLQYYPGGGGTG